MSNKDFAVAVNKFFFYAMNYDSVAITYPTLWNGKVTNYLPSFFNAFDKMDIEHLWGKFQSAYNRSGCRGAIMDFYGELDGSNRAKFLTWINNNFKQRDDFGISMAMLEGNEVEEVGA